MKVYGLWYVERQPDTNTIVSKTLVGVYASEKLASVAMRTRALEWCNRNPGYDTGTETETHVSYSLGYNQHRFSIGEYEVIGAITR